MLPADHSARVSVLRLNDLSLAVHLGCGPEERAETQEVRMSVEFRFLQTPVAERSDDLTDTICYARASAILKEICTGREFHLIEHMAFECENALRRMVEGRAQLALRVHKVRPPVPGLLGGTQYICGDFLL